MKHFYKKIPGWFTFPSLYKKIVETYNDATFVEVGSWKGKSAAYMAVEIANSKKNIKFYCVDPLEGFGSYGYDVSTKLSAKDLIKYSSDEFYKEFLNNLKNVEGYYEVIREFSVAASKQFENESLDFVFLDASHDYKNVKIDIESWWPKVKIGGVLAGHDYVIGQWDGVVNAVNDFARKKRINFHVTNEWCWVIDKVK